MNIATSTERGKADAPALIFGGRTITYAALDASVNRVANALADLGVGLGDRVGIFLDNCPEYVQVYLATLKLGAIAVSLNAGLTRREAAYILDDSGAKLVVTSEDRRAAVPEGELPRLERVIIARGEAGPDASLAALTATVSDVRRAREMGVDDPSAIVYTSGTTGDPKGVTLSHGNVLSNMAAKREYLGIRSDDRLLLFMPLFHCFGQNAILNAGLGAGAAVVLHDGFALDEISRSLRQDRVTMLFGIPTTFILLAHHASDADMGTVRYCMSAAATLPREIEDAWLARFELPIHQGYGLTETTPFASYNHRTDYRPGTIGQPIDGVQMRIVDVETKQPLPVGMTGEIAIKGPNVMLGYWGRPEETAAAIRDGWLLSGDIGSMDTDGYFTISDRLKDMISVGAQKVWPAEVENVLYAHAGVGEAAVFGLPDALMGEKVAAAIVPKDEIDLESVRALCRAQLARYKQPSACFVVDSLPKSPTGKVLKRVLRERHSGGTESVAVPVSRAFDSHTGSSPR